MKTAKGVCPGGAIDARAIAEDDPGAMGDADDRAADEARFALELDTLEPAFELPQSGWPLADVSEQGAQKRGRGVVAHAAGRIRVEWRMSIQTRGSGAVRNRE